MNESQGLTMCWLGKTHLEPQNWLEKGLWDHTNSLLFLVPFHVIDKRGMPRTVTALGSHTSTKRLSVRPPSLGAALLRTCSLSQAPPSLFFNSLPPRPGWEMGMMSTRNKKQVMRAFRRLSPHPPTNPQLPSSKPFVFCSSWETGHYVPREWEETRGRELFREVQQSQGEAEDWGMESDSLELAWSHTRLCSV